MNLSNFAELTNAFGRTVNDAGDGAPLVDLVEVWRKNCSTDVMNYINPNDFFRGMCMWLQADAIETDTLSKIARYSESYLAFYAKFMADYCQEVVENMNENVAMMLDVLRVESMEAYPQ